MKFIVKKTGKLLIVTTETNKQSIITDIVTIIVATFLVGVLCVYAYFFGRSWVFELVGVFVFFLFTFSKIGEKKKTYTKEEFKKMIDEL